MFTTSLLHGTVGQDGQARYGVVMCGVHGSQWDSPTILHGMSALGGREGPMYRPAPCCYLLAVQYAQYNNHAMFLNPLQV